MNHPQNCPDCNEYCELAYDDDDTQYRCENKNCSVEIYETDTDSLTDYYILERNK